MKIARVGGLVQPGLALLYAIVVFGQSSFSGAINSTRIDDGAMTIKIISCSIEAVK